MVEWEDDRGKYLYSVSHMRRTSNHLPTLGCPCSALADPAQRLATTEQSEVMSWTRSILFTRCIVGCVGSLTPSRGMPISANASRGLLHPANVLSCKGDNRSGWESTNSSWPSSNMNSSGAGSSFHGGNMKPFNFDPSRRMISSRVVSLRFDLGGFKPALDGKEEIATPPRPVLRVSSLIFSAFVKSSLHFASSRSFPVLLEARRRACMYSSVALIVASRAAWLENARAAFRSATRAFPSRVSRVGVFMARGV
jgi:hypothetical protein